MLSELQKILNILGIFSDTSISKDIVTITTDSFLELTGTKKNLPTVIKSVLSGMVENVKDYIGKNDNNDSTIEELKKEIDKEIDEVFLTVIHVNPMDVKKTKK